MKHLYNVVLAAILLSFGGVSGAADKAASTGWAADAELGYVMASGNTETSALNLKAGVKHSTSARIHGGRIEYTRTEDSNRTIGQRFLISGRSEFDFTGNSYLFLTANYEDDRFSGNDYQASEAGGYGQYLISDDILEMKAEIGAGARQTKPINGDTENSGIVRLAGLLEWNISDGATLSEEFAVESGSGNTVTKSVTALNSSISGRLSSKITYTWKHSSEVPAGFEKSDSELAVTMVYSF